MSKETQNWLESNVRVGFNEAKKVAAWWYQGDSQSHFPGAVPFDEARRLLDFPVEEITLTGTDSQGRQVNPDRKAYYRPDTQDTLGVHTHGHVNHPYVQTLLQGLANLMDQGSDELGIASVGLLKKGAQAWVQVEVPETYTVQGFSFRPFALASTSYDGSLATGWTRGSTLAVCDNTLSAALSSKDAVTIKCKHTKNSIPKISALRDLLGIITATADDFTAEFEALTAIDVSDKQWEQFVDLHTPLPEKQSTEKPGRSYSIAANKRDAMFGLWESSPMVAPFRNTGFGVVQTVNTWERHEKSSGGFAGGNREREWGVVAERKLDTRDQTTLDLLDRVLVSA